MIDLILISLTIIGYMMLAIGSLWAVISLAAYILEKGYYND